VTSSNLPTRLVAGGLTVAAIGIPILETWEALFLAASLLALVFGESKPGWWRLGAAAGLVLAVVGCKTVLPRADIAEAHNAFMVIHDGEPLQRGLPAEVFRSWKAQFDTLYPPDVEPYSARSQWRTSGSPKALFTQSADAIWRRAKYTRQVDAIRFRTLGEFRGGFANDMQYNFWAGELRRESMPFYVMYELTAAAEGSALAWNGQVFWERADGEFDEIFHEQIAARRITSDDAGKRVYAVFFPKRDPELYFRMEPSLKLRLAGWLDALLSIVGGISVLMLTVRQGGSAYLRAMSIFSAGYLLMVSFIAVSVGKYLGKGYPPQGGGDDGLVHDGWGRGMAMLAGRGEIVEALQGSEAVYWFTPGTRYVRMVEKLIFGDTNLLYALLVPCIPIVVFFLVRHFVGTRWAWAVTATCCVMPVGNLSFLQYLANAKLGYGEAVAGGLFLLGLLVMLRTQAGWGGTERNLPMVWGAGAALAASMFIRPNYAFAVVWLGAAYTWASLRRRDVGPVVALGLGLALALWMPLHNWYYGGEFYLISESGRTYALSLGVGDYVSAFGDLLRGRADTDAVILTSEQLKGWLWDPGFLVRPELQSLAWAAHGIKLLALTVTCWVVFRGIVGVLAKETALAIVAMAAICAHVPMLFTYTTHYRYAMLGWDLSLVVLIVWLARLSRRMPKSNPSLV
jgi:hypothetical protein